MRKELEDKILDKYDNEDYFGKYAYEIDLQNNFKCKDGWFNLIYCMMQSIDDYCKAFNISIGIEYICNKRGRLWIACHPHLPNDKLRGIIKMAEDMSQYICEECGNSGEKKIYGKQYATLCKNHSSILTKKINGDFDILD